MCCPVLLGVVLVLRDGTLRALETDIPRAVLRALPRRRKLIYYYELLWPARAAFAWRDFLVGSFVMFYEDNDGARHNLMNGVPPMPLPQ